MANQRIAEQPCVRDDIRAARRKAGWSLADLAAASGVSKGYVSQIENGYTPRDSTVLRRIEQVLRSATAAARGEV